MGPKKGNSQPQKQSLEPPESAPTKDIIFDIATTGLSRTKDQITQIAAATTDLEHKFDIYILPTIEIPKAAAELTGLSLNEKCCMVRHNCELETVTLRTGFQSFIEFLEDPEERKKDTGHFLINLLGHNCINFDMPFIYQALFKFHLLRRFKKIVCAITDTLHVFKKAMPEMESYKQQDLYRKVFQDDYEAHNAVEDVRALARLMLEVEEYDVCPHTYSYASVIERIKFNTGTRERVKSLDVLVTENVISTYMAKKMAEIGINFTDLEKAYGEGNVQGLLTSLSTANEDGKPRETNKEKIRIKLHDYFKEQKKRKITATQSPTTANPGEGACAAQFENLKM